MDKDELKTFLTIHIREGASQVVLLFMDELPTFKLLWYWYREVWNENEDKDEDAEMLSILLYIRRQAYSLVPLPNAPQFWREKWKSYMNLK